MPAAPAPRYPSLLQFNTRVVLRETAAALGRPATLDDLSDTGLVGRELARAVDNWGRASYQQLLPDLSDDDICGSPFAVRSYDAHADFGGDAALARLRQRLRARGLRLLLDFVPNHTALDHPWVEDHPEYYLSGTELQLTRAPQNYIRVERKRGKVLLAHGRDPYFSGWPDTLQLDYGNPATQHAMAGELLRIGGLCDG